jgi:hypothetical protein
LKKCDGKKEKNGGKNMKKFRIAGCTHRVGVTLKGNVLMDGRVAVDWSHVCEFFRTSCGADIKFWCYKGVLYLSLYGDRCLTIQYNLAVDKHDLMHAVAEDLLSFVLHGLDYLL